MNGDTFTALLTQCDLAARVRVMVACALHGRPKRRRARPEPAKRDTDLLTTGQAAKLVGVPYETVRYWVSHDLLPIADYAGCRKGRRLIHRADLLAFEPPRKRK